jgi:hypothetical protein
MAKRKQDKIKHFRGKRQAVQAATDAWMIGNVGPTEAQAPQTQEPSFYVDTTTSIEHVVTEPVTVTKGRKSTRGKQKQPQEAAPAHAMPPNTTAITTALPTTPEVVPNTKPQAAAMHRRAAITQDVDEESVHDFDEADMGAFYHEHNDEEEEEEAEVEVQIVTPRGKTAGVPATAGVEAEVILTVVQYQAIIRDYKERLLMAERQVRAISKTSLADRFMENEVRKYVKESLWKRCKFITCTETMSDCMNEVAAQFAIVGDKREHWKSTYAHAVRDALNNQRNNTSQDLKKELSGKWRGQGWDCNVDDDIWSYTLMLCCNDGQPYVMNIQECMYHPKSFTTCGHAMQRTTLNHFGCSLIAWLPPSLERKYGPTETKSGCLFQQVVRSPLSMKLLLSLQYRTTGRSGLAQPEYHHLQSGLIPDRATHSTWDGMKRPIAGLIKFAIASNSNVQPFTPSN